MSTENRNKVLLGFGALVVVLIAAIALWPPNFRKEDASGAIGAVQKHRAPQITQKDVILGDETVRHEQKVLYADFLADAAKLRAMDARQAGARQGIMAMRDELKVRYAEEANEVLARASAARIASQAEIDDLRAKVAAGREILGEDMDSSNVRLGHLASRDSEDFMSRLTKAEEALAVAMNKLNARPAESAKALEEVEVALEARPYAVRLADEVEYLVAVRKELKALDDIEALYAKKVADEEIAHKLVAEADLVEAKAIKNIGSNFDLNVKMAEALARLDQRFAEAKKAFAAQAGMEARYSEAITKSIGAISQALAKSDADFRSRANAEVRGELAALGVIIDSRKEANAAALQNELLAMEQQFEAKAALARFLPAAEFQTEARGLLNRGEALQAKAQQ